MCFNNYFGPFMKKSKLNEVINISNFYSDSDFAKMYEYLTVVDENINNDIPIILENISKEERILEIGSGSGRVFNLLSEKGYDIYGLEPEKEMSKYITEKYRHKIFDFGIERISEISYLGFDKIIIPATTVSLFSRNEFERFLEDSKAIILNEGAILFDFISVSKETVIGKVNKLEIDNKKYFYSNYLNEESFYLNAYVSYKGVKKIGYSKKYLYDISYLKSVVKKLEMNLKIIESDKEYTFVEVKNE